jgi:uncharacterized protein involved in exopolysaccharide biosynthesis
VSQPGTSWEVSWKSAWHLLWKRSTLIVAIVAGILTGAVSLALPKSYRAEAKILPNLVDQGGSPLRGLAASGLESFLSGAFPGAENPILTYPEIMSSRTVLERVVLSPYPPGTINPRATVLSALGVPSAPPRLMIEQGIARLRDIGKVYANPRSGIIVVSAVTHDSLLSASIVQRMLDELERFNAISRASQGHAAREFVEARLKEARAELAASEQALANFRQTNVHLNNSPQLQLQDARLDREVQTRVDIYRLLAREYESARIEEKRERPTISIIDPPRPPVRKYRPRVLLNVLVGMSCAIGLRFAIVSLFPSRWSDERRRRAA